MGWEQEAKVVVVVSVASAKARCDGTTKVICDIILHRNAVLLFFSGEGVFSSGIFGEEIFCAAYYDG